MRDFDFLDVVDAQIVKERRADMIGRNEQMRQNDARLAAEAKARADATTHRANVRAMIGEYRAAGVAPPFVDGDGIPRVSLSLLLWQGWKVEQVDGVMQLTQPYRPPRKSREDYERERSDGS